MAMKGILGMWYCMIFLLGRGGDGAGESRRDKNLVFFLNFASIMNNSRGPFEYAKRT